MRLSNTITATFPPPVMEARRWIEGVTFPKDRPLLNLSQAAPADAPPTPILDEIARVTRQDTSAHLYGPVLGMPELRDEVASQWSHAYGGQVTAADVAITSGCNQAFTAAISALAAPGDNVILPAPYYFNHIMHLTMAGIEARPVMCGGDMCPDPESLAAAMDDRTAALVLITPNNPTGAEYPAPLVAACRDLARQKGIALIVDETYRDFHSASGRPHDLFADPEWRDVLIHLYSFSKAYRLTGHRVGAMIAAPNVLAEAEKYLDTVTICPNQIGQRAALYGLRHLAQWVAGERDEVLARRAAMEHSFPKMGVGTLRSVGAYFAYIEHPWDIPSDILAQRLVAEQSLLLLPGTMFAPRNTDGTAERTFRVAFANADAAGIETFSQRFAAFSA